MKTLIATALLSLSAVPCHAQSAQSMQSRAMVAEQSRSRPVVMENAEQCTMRSKAGRIYEISMARAAASARAHGDPVMYVLDSSTAMKLMREAHQVENSAQLAAALSSLAADGLDVHRVAFPDETHNSDYYVSRLQNEASPVAD